MDAEIRVAIDRDADIVTARQRGRNLALQLGFSGGEAIVVATAISEMSRNIVAYARRGEIVLGAREERGRRGIVIVAHDDGPGIADVEEAMRDGFSTAGGLGLGFPGVRRLMDEFSIESAPGRGTTVTMAKWRR